jgi:hypothetical protein
MTPNPDFVSIRHRFQAWYMQCQFHHLNNKIGALSDICNTYSTLFSDLEAIMHHVAVIVQKVLTDASFQLDRF